MVFGDGAAAVLVGSEKPIAIFKDSYSLSYDFVDQLRGANTIYNRQWEDRWVRDMGYEKFIPEAITGLCRQQGLKPSDFAKVIYPCYYGAARRNINKKLGLEPAQVEDDLLQESGDTGTAHPLLMLSKALEEASPGDKLLLVSYGSGCDALYFEVTPDIARFNDRKRFSDTLTRRAELDNYTKYDLARHGSRGSCLRGEEEQVTRWSMIWRSRKAIHGLQEAAVTSAAHSSIRRSGSALTPTAEQLMKWHRSTSRTRVERSSVTLQIRLPLINPPAIYGHVDFNGGGRTMFEFTDCTLEDLQVGRPVEFTFRIKYYDPKRDTTFYFWKAVPATKEVP